MPEIDADGLVLARAFMAKMAGIARLMHTRTQLELLYTTSWDAWAPSGAKPVSFGVVLYALAHGERVVSVRYSRELVWA